MSEHQQNMIMILNEFRNAKDLKDLYIGEKIPKRKMKNAQVHYGIDHDAKLLALIDCTVLGSAKNGIAITTKGVWLNYDKINAKFSWGELVSIKDKIKKSFMSLAANKINFGDRCTIPTAGSNMASGDIVKTLHICIEYVMENNIKELDSMKNTEESISQVDEGSLRAKDLILIEALGAITSLNDSSYRKILKILESELFDQDLSTCREKLEEFIDLYTHEIQKPLLVFKLKVDSLIDNISKYADQINVNELNIILNDIEAIESLSENKQYLFSEIKNTISQGR